MATRRPSARCTFSVALFLLGHAVLFSGCSPDGGAGSCPDTAKWQTRPLTPQLSLYESSRYLYEETDGDESTLPRQKLASPSMIDAQFAAVVTGEVYDDQGDPLTCVQVSAKLASAPEGTATWTWQDRSRTQLLDKAPRNAGVYDLVVNGGAQPVTLRFERPGYLPVTRTLHATPGRTGFVEPVVMVREPDPQSGTVITLGGSALQIAESAPRGGASRDYLFVPPQNEACLAPQQDAELPYGTERSGKCVAISQFRLNVIEMGAGLIDKISDVPHSAALPSDLRSTDRELPPSYFMHTVKYHFSDYGDFDEPVNPSLKFKLPVVAYTEYYNEAAEQDAKANGRGIGALDESSLVPAAYLGTGETLWATTDNGQVITLEFLDGETLHVLPSGLDKELSAEERSALAVRFKERYLALKASGRKLRLWRTLLRHFTDVDNSRKTEPPAGAEGPPSELKVSTKEVSLRNTCTGDSKPTSRFKLDCNSQTFTYQIDEDAVPADEDLPPGVHLNMHSSMMPGYLSGADVSLQVVKEGFTFSPFLGPLFRGARVTIEVDNVRPTRILPKEQLEVLASPRAPNPGRYVFPDLWKDLAAIGPLRGAWQANVAVTYLWAGRPSQNNKMNAAGSWGDYSAWEQVTDLESPDWVGLRSPKEPKNTVTLHFLGSQLAQHPVFRPFMGLGLNIYHGYNDASQLLTRGDGRIVSALLYLPLATVPFIPLREGDSEPLRMLGAPLQILAHGDKLYVADSGRCQLMTYSNSAAPLAELTLGQAYQKDLSGACRYVLPAMMLGTPTAVAHDDTQLLIATKDSKNRILAFARNQLLELLGGASKDFALPPGWNQMTGLDAFLHPIKQMAGVSKGLRNATHSGVYFIEELPGSKWRLRYAEYDPNYSNTMMGRPVTVLDVIPEAKGETPQHLAVAVEEERPTPTSPLQTVHRVYTTSITSKLQLTTVRSSGTMVSSDFDKTFTAGALALAVPAPGDTKRQLYFADPVNGGIHRIRFSIGSGDVVSDSTFTPVAGTSLTSRTRTSLFCYQQIPSGDALLAENTGFRNPLSLSVAPSGDLYMLSTTDGRTPQICRFERNSKAPITQIAKDYDFVIDDDPANPERTAYAFSRVKGQHMGTWVESSRGSGSFVQRYQFVHAADGDLAAIQNMMQPKESITVYSKTRGQTCENGATRCLIYSPNGRSINLTPSPNSAGLVGNVRLSSGRDIKVRYEDSMITGEPLPLAKVIEAPEARYELDYDDGGRVKGCMTNNGTMPFVVKPR